MKNTKSKSRSKIIFVTAFIFDRTDAFCVLKVKGVDDMTPKSAEETEKAVEKYGDMLFRICFVMLKNTHNAEDAVSDTILKYIQNSPVFASPNHEKAWLIRVAQNRCRDIYRSAARHPQSEISEVSAYITDDESCGITEALMKLPEKFRIVMVLHYVEEYTTAEIAKIIKKTPSAVKMRLKKGRSLLEKIYREEYLQ